ncbi:MAG: tannase/feruloyl esterase family alpha/beta hydrolase [Kordiimonadaceae bacterium]|jgi:hypothetical protein|nr:tannase/feruloyl esterase family alpha/beta hydrolase [Kordiimonadaceae bacterium]MBT6036836.1 tannase/feruloyl esterase family alpha/beta hydrolase [Kordiimonadaceae bacterium]MBT6330904.1 tannase/feruloyl esterase family alpha/beta hydrolase [Kordiimonadaceae bacterium]
MRRTLLILLGFSLFLFNTLQAQESDYNCKAILHNYSNPTVTLISTSDIDAGQRNPAYCKVRGTIAPDIGFEVHLPKDWNDRFYMVGNEGAGGKVNVRYMGQPLNLKYAVASTDLGHNGYMEEENYGYNNRQKVIDYGFRATHLTAKIAQEIVNNYYNKPADYSYYVAGSAGARQGMMEVQRFPNDFDGYLLAAPVYNISAIHMWAIWKAKALSGEGAIHPDKIEHLANAIYARCDDIDGVSDGVIENPLACDFDPAVHLKNCTDGADCFTDGQISALNKIYDGVRNSAGDLIFPGQPFGAEAKGDQPSYMRTNGPQSAWINSIVFGEDQVDRYVEFAESYMRYMAFPLDDPDYSWKNFDFDKDPARLSDAAEITDAVDADLSFLKASGAKVIHYHHWADTAVPASNSIAYYDRVMKQMGDTSDYYKFYLVPGGFHGAPGVGATTLPWLDTIVNWVENGLEPDELVANRVKNDDVQFSRKICPYPSIAVYKGSGNNTSSDNFECSIER